MPQISYVARSFIEERLLDANSGLSSWINFIIERGEYPARALADAGLVLGVSFLKGSNLFLGDVSPETIGEAGTTDGGSALTFPYIALASVKGRNESLVTPSIWSGPVLSYVKVVLAWQPPAFPSDPESPMDAIVDAMATTFNSQDYYSLTPPGLTYNNELEYNFDPPIKRQGGQSWQRTAHFTITHRVVTCA